MLNDPSTTQFRLDDDASHAGSRLLKTTYPFDSSAESDKRHWHLGADAKPFAPYRACTPHHGESVPSVLARIAKFNGEVHPNHAYVKRSQHLRLHGHVCKLSALADLDPYHLVTNHTCLPYTQAFLAPRQHEYGNQVSPFDSTSTRWHSLLSALPRYCPLCVQADKCEYPYAYWRRHHQIRGIDLCPAHGVGLIVADVDPAALLPSDVVGNAAYSEQVVSANVDVLSRDISTVILELLTSQASISTAAVSSALRGKALERSLTIKTKRPGVPTTSSLLKHHPASALSWVEPLICAKFRPRRTLASCIDSAFYGEVSNPATIAAAAVLLTGSAHEAVLLIRGAALGHLVRPATVVSGK